MSEAAPPGKVEWGARVGSALVMVVAAIAATVGGGYLFGAIVAGAAYAALREWHRLVNGGNFARETIPAFLSVFAAIWLVLQGYGAIWPVATVAAGAALSALLAALRGSYVIWHGAGVLYIGLPVVALMALRESPSGGGVVVGGLFVAVWAADIGALLMGRLLGGPKLAPGLSPHKTWAGFGGGLLAAGLAEALYAACVGGAVVPSILLGVYLGFAAHCGDLFESWVKRQFRAKNMGMLIPGHGGMLDRIDSLLLAAPAAAALIFWLGFDPLVNVTP